MKYVDRVVRPDESILLRGKLHWIIYAPAFVFASIAVACAIAPSTAFGQAVMRDTTVWVLACLFFFTGALIAIRLKLD